jgi:putrescine---pyruvate transaminase
MTLDQLRELDRKHYLHPASPIRDHYELGPSVMMDRGEGIYLFDIEGKRYLDGLSSLWNVNVGHGRVRLAEAAAKQMSRLAYSHSFNRFSHENAVLLAAKIAELTPGDLDVCQFTSGGSEANDTAIKLARHYFRLNGEPGRNKILSRKRAYHGVSLGATSATGLPAFHEMSAPLAGGFVHGPSPFCYHCELGLTFPSCQIACAVQGMKALIEAEGSDTVAAIILEPIQASGGVVVPPIGYLQAIRSLCDQYGILMIVDEVITGFGRTGKWFAIEHEYGVVPDMMTFAKGVTSGYLPLGGVIMTERMHKQLVQNSTQSLAHGYTYSGHPAACAVALENIRILEEEDLIRNAETMGHVLLGRLKTLQQRYAIIGNVSGRGLLAAIEFVQDRTACRSFDPSMKIVQRVYESALRKGLITRPISHMGTDILGLCPPLTITEPQIEDIVDILSDVLSEVTAELLLNN